MIHLNSWSIDSIYAWTSVVFEYKWILDIGLDSIKFQYLIEYILIFSTKTSSAVYLQKAEMRDYPNSKYVSFMTGCPNERTKNAKTYSAEAHNMR